MLTQYIKKLVGFNRNMIVKKSYEKIEKTIINDKRIIMTGSLRPILDIAQSFHASNSSPAAAVCEIATFLLHSGYPELAEKYHKLSLKLDLNPATYSLYLQGLLFNPVCTQEQMFHAASQYNKLFLSRIKKYKKYENDLTKNKILNIGYICSFFHNSVSKSLLLPALKTFNRERVKIFCYSDGEPNEVPDDVKSVADVWRDTQKLDDEDLATLIKNDKIDILLEINGHIVVNRYLTIARKPAPIQVSYYNIATTTGVAAIDYLIAGDDMSFDKKNPYYTESIYIFKGVSGTAKFSDAFPEVTREPPCLNNKFITFGSFGGSQKVNKGVIKLWCQILKRIPDAHFYMKAGILTFEPFINSYKLIFEAEGIDLNRIHFEGHSEHYEMLRQYAKVDIALDTFPHCGGTTTMEAIWQGIPVITLYGTRQSMQHGKAILNSIGHPELVAYSEEEYINKAIQLASNPTRLTQYRQQLREDFKRSPNADPATFTKNLEDAFLDMWSKYCDSVV